MVRKFKHHEQKLLKKVNLFEWGKTSNNFESLVIRRYHIQNREDYVFYNKLVGLISKLANEISLLPLEDVIRAELTVSLLDRLYDHGIISDKGSLSQLQRLTVSSVARRRLSVILMKLKMTETIKQAVSLIEQGNIRVGPQCITNSAFHVTRSAEDFITWSYSSKIRNKIADYKGQRDDYELIS